MRALMMLASLFVVGTGTFCLANSSVPFISVAFIIGIAVLFMGIIELVVNRATVMSSYETENEVDVEGLTAVILGVAFLAGFASDDVAVVAIFALWTTIEGLKAASANGITFKFTREDSFTRILGVIMTVWGVYMFFNPAIFNFKVMFMVGVSMVLMGVNRSRVPMAIEHRKPEFLTGNKEKLTEAKREEKLAMDRAKTAIRETKEIQRRIEKIKKDIDKEESMMSRIEERRRSGNNN